MKRSYVVAAGLVFMAAQILVFQNCSQTKMGFSGPAQASDITTGDGNNTPTVPQGAGGGGSVVGTVPTCTITNVSETIPVKVLFLIDTSGSNANPGTDIGKVWRKDVLDDFLAANAGKSNFSYNIATFQGDKTTSYILDSSKHPIFSSDPAAVQNAEQLFLKDTDGSNTPYKSALQFASNLIAADLAVAQDPTTKYLVIFLSDGQPNPDYGSGTDLASAQSDVQTLLVDLAPNQVSFNGVYYYNSQDASGYIQQASAFLSGMSSAGNGTFLVADTATQSLQVSDTITIPQQECDGALPK